MRILEGYSKEEQKELEEAKDNDFNSAIDLINGITDDDDDCIALTGKYMDEYSDADNQLARDIADFYCGRAKFPEQKYYVKLPKLGFPYLVQVEYGLGWVRHLKSGYKYEFTEDEIKAIDPRYMAFALEV